MIADTLTKLQRGQQPPPPQTNRIKKMKITFKKNGTVKLQNYEVGLISKSKIWRFNWSGILCGGKSLSKLRKAGLDLSYEAPTLRELKSSLKQITPNQIKQIEAILTSQRSRENLKTHQDSKMINELFRGLGFGGSDD